MIALSVENLKHFFVFSKRSQMKSKRGQIDVRPRLIEFSYDFTPD